MDIGMNETCTSWIECGDPLGFMTDFVLSTHLQSNKGRVYGVLRHNKPFLVDQGWYVYISIFLFYTHHIPAILNSLFEILCMWINFQGKMFFTDQNFCNNAAFYSREYLTLHFIATVPALCFKTFFDKYIFIRKKLLWVETILDVCKSWPRRGSNTWTDYIWMIIVLLVNCWKVP